MLRHYRVYLALVTAMGVGGLINTNVYAAQTKEQLAASRAAAKAACEGKKEGDKVSIQIPGKTPRPASCHTVKGVLTAVGGASIGP